MWSLQNAVAGGGAFQLVAGKSYFGRLTIVYGSSTYETGITFTISVSEELAGVSTDLTGLESEISGLKGTVTADGELTRKELDGIRDETGRLLVATEDTIPKQITEETGGLKEQVTTIEKSGILNRETTVLLGETLVIRYRTYPNAAPVITVYDPNNLVRIASARMAEVASGLFAYAVTFETTWPVGDYTIVCSEPNYGTMDAIVITATTTSLETVSGDVSAVLGNVTGTRDVASTVKALQAALGIVEENITRAAEALAGADLGTEASKAAAEQLAALFGVLKELSSKIKELGGTEGLDVDKLYEMEGARANDLAYIRNKAQELKALLELNQQMLESTTKDQCIIQVWMEFR